jgi:CheY-like chemotaxis protein
VANENLLEGKKILIVDDEPDVLETLEDLLPVSELAKASSFKEAQQMLNTQEFDLVILDIMGVEGYQLLETAVEKKLTAVMLTAHALSPEDTKKSHEKGAAYYLPKEEMIHITKHLNIVLAAQKEGKNTWFSWLDKFASFYDQKFGSNWQDNDKDFWDKFKIYY